MSPDPSVSIISDGTISGTEVRINGKLVPARCVTWRADADDRHPVADIELDVVHVQVAGNVRWHGLEHVPSEVLREHLDQREPT